MVRFLFLFSSITSVIFSAGYSAHIQKAVTYFEQKKKRIDPMSIFTLDFLQRNYGLKINISAARQQLLANPPKILRPLMRVLDNRFILPELEIRVIKGAKGIVPTAIYCDVYPLPWDFFRNIREVTTRLGGSTVISSIHALAIIDWQGCAYDEVLRARELEALVAKIPVILKQEKITSDLWVECILALYLAGKNEWVTPDMLAALTKAQLPNGLWQNNEQTTAKAIWVLILAEEKKRQRKPQVCTQTRA